MSEFTPKPLHFKSIGRARRFGGRRQTGAVSAPIHLSTTFERAHDGTFPSGYAIHQRQPESPCARRGGGGARGGGANAVAFASGMAATQAVFQTLAPGDHVIIPLDAYFGTAKLLHEQFEPWG